MDLIFLTKINDWKTYFIVEAGTFRIKAGTAKRHLIEYTQNNIGLISGACGILCIRRYCRKLTNYSKHIKCYHFKRCSAFVNNF
jgi:hypothetical protein